MAGMAAKHGVQWLNAQETGLSGQTRASFVQSAIASCVRNQIADPENKGIAGPVIDDYCKCYANGMADRITLEEIKRLDADRSHDMKTRMASAIATASEPCLAEVVQKVTKAK